MTESIAAVAGASKVGNDALWKLVQVGKSLSINPDWLAAVISSESGFDPAAFNPSGGATGLIQFMPKTAERLGTTTTALRGMSAEAQLDYVRKFYEPWAGRIGTLGDLYMATFLPVYVGKPRDFPVAVRDSSEVISGTLTKGKVYSQNAGLDADHDGTITAGEVYARVERTLRAAGDKRIELTEPAPFGIGGAGGGFWPLALVGGVAYAAIKWKKWLK